MPHCNTIAICNQKGGVGKTTTTVNLGVGLAMQGKKVLLVDADPQGDLTTCLGWQDTDNLPVALPDKMVEVMQDKCKDPMNGILHHKEGVDLIPSNSDLFDFEISLVTAMNREAILRNYLNEVKHNYDYIIIDCSPSLGMMTLNALSAADSVIIPVQAHYLPAKCMTQLMRTITKVKKHINPKLRIDGILLTLVDNRTNLAKSTIMVESNYQRTQQLPSERAFAYKMRLEAMARQGKRTDLTCATELHKSDGKKSRDTVADKSGETVRRYIRLW